ncbi:DoxX subfamily [Lutibacter sp.]|uniref:DoxX subfamily n=1 Tax=Lutibacter sp. TaxID=1925666 RepID=UPI002736EAD4|nr:DoxX subfamily [Lutibacter sp.]MDP3312865.1 DoxX subfamily [Lutibacter sp.]
MSEITNTRSLRGSIVLLRVLIGWHFLYEGIIKLYNPDWTALGYLSSAQGPFKQVFYAMTNQSFIGWIDGLNMAALIIVGLTFSLGFSEKKGAFIAIGLLAMYYLAHPPFPWLIQINTEGNYWFVNKNLIELAACLIIYQYPTGKYFGLDRFFKMNKKENK